MTSNKKESFKLLQLSDDSKSLSDLELPEINTQRKRKILRKTRNTSPHSRHSHHGHDPPPTSSVMAGACTNFGLWIAIVMSCGWLFILSYMTAVVYTENRRLGVEVSKLVAASQSMPDELQLWHETSKQLEQNQTAIFIRFQEIDQRIINIEKGILSVRDSLKKSDDSSYNEKLNILQTNVANFGAHIKDLGIEVDTLKGRVQEMKVLETETKENLTKLETFIHSGNSTLTGAGGSSGIVPGLINNETVVWLVHNLTDIYQEQWHTLSNQIITINDTLTQRAKGLDDDVRDHKTKLDSLTENFANMTSHVISIQNDLARLKLSANDANTVTTTSTAAPIAPAVATILLPTPTSLPSSSPSPPLPPSSPPPASSTPLPLLLANQNQTQTQPTGNATR